MPPCAGMGAADGIGPAQAPSRIKIIIYNMIISFPPRRGEHPQRQAPLAQPPQLLPAPTRHCPVTNLQKRHGPWTETLRSLEAPHALRRHRSQARGAGQARGGVARTHVAHLHARHLLVLAVGVLVRLRGRVVRLLRVVGHEDLALVSHILQQILHQCRLMCVVPSSSLTSRCHTCTRWCARACKRRVGSALRC
jgi:hypothetical protein